MTVFENLFEIRNNCPICLKSNPKILLSNNLSEPKFKKFIDDYYNHLVDERVIEKGKFELAQCLRCDFVWQRHILNKDLLYKLYSQWINPRQSLLKHLKSQSKLIVLFGLSLQIKLMLFLINDINQPKVLDYGCGWGRWCLMAQIAGCDVYAFDIVSSRRMFVSSKGIKLFNWNDNNQIEFDFINIEQVLEHVSDPKTFLNKISSILKSGGVVTISVPKRLTKKQLKETPAKNSVQPLEHINCFEPSNLEFLAKEADLEILKINLSLLHLLKSFKLDNLVLAFYCVYFYSRTQRIYLRKN